MGTINIPQPKFCAARYHKKIVSGSIVAIILISSMLSLFLPIGKCVPVESYLSLTLLTDGYDILTPLNTTETYMFELNISDAMGNIMQVNISVPNGFIIDTASLTSPWCYYWELLGWSVYQLGNNISYVYENYPYLGDTTFNDFPWLDGKMYVFFDVRAPNINGTYVWEVTGWFDDGNYDTDLIESIVVEQDICVYYVDISGPVTADGDFGNTTLTIDAWIMNDGATNEPEITVDCTIYDNVSYEIEYTASTTLALDAGNIEQVTFNWNPSAEGIYYVNVSAYLSAPDEYYANDYINQSIIVQNHTDIAINAITISGATVNDAYANETHDIFIDIRNLGNTEVAEIIVNCTVFNATNNEVEKYFTNQTISLAWNELITVTFTSWLPSAEGDYYINSTVVVPTGLDENTANNLYTEWVHIETISDIQVTIENLDAPNYLPEYLDIPVTVSNLGNVEVTEFNVSVAIYQQTAEFIVASDDMETGAQDWVTVDYTGIIGDLWHLNQPNHVAHVVISEVCYDPPFAEGDTEWIELYNPTSAPIDISGWTIDTTTHLADVTLPAGAIIPPYGYYLIADEDDNGNWPAYWATPDYAAEELVLGNTDGGLRLNNSGIIVDAVGWGSPPVDFYESTPAPQVAENYTLERKPGYDEPAAGNYWDTDNNTYDLLANSVPEPQNTGSSPEGTNTWWRCANESTGNYVNLMNNALISPTINLGGLLDAKLTFSHRYDFESGYDGGIVEINPGGTGWVQLEPEGGYPDTIDSSYGNPLGDVNAYTGLLADWTTAEFDLTSFVGNPINIRFRVGTDLFTSDYSGWFIDNFTVLGISYVLIETINVTISSLMPGEYTEVLVGYNFTLPGTGTYRIIAEHWLPPGEDTDPTNDKDIKDIVVQYNVDVGVTAINEPVGLPNILIVDDDNSFVGAPGAPYTNVTSYMTETFDYLGIPYNLYVVPTGANGPDLSILSEYELVIWMTGYEWGVWPTLTITDRINLMAYLDAGGYLWLISEDVIYDVEGSMATEPTDTFIADYLHVAEMMQDVGTADPLEGIAGTFTETMSFDTATVFDGEDYGDDILPAPPAYGIFTSPNTNYGAICYNGADYKIVFYAFEFAFITELTARATVVDATLTYLFPDSDFIPYNTNVPLIINATVHNYGTFPATFDVWCNISYTDNGTATGYSELLTVIDLPPCMDYYVEFDWNTGGSETNYTITVEAYIAGENLATDNNAESVNIVVDDFYDAGTISVSVLNATTLEPEPFYFTHAAVVITATIKNFGNVELTSIPMNCTVINATTGALIWSCDTVVTDTLAPGSTAYITFPEIWTTPAIEGDYRVIVTTLLAGDEHIINNATMVVTTVNDIVDAAVIDIMMSGIPAADTGEFALGLHYINATVLNAGNLEQTFSVNCTVGKLNTPEIRFTDDMEADTTIYDWSLINFSTTAPNLWHIIDSTSPYSDYHSAVRCWWFGNDIADGITTGYYADNCIALLATPEINLAGATTVELSFWHKYNLEPGCDYGYLLISWDGYFWYYIANATGEPIAFTGDSEGWLHTTLDLTWVLTAELDLTIYLGFNFESDATTAAYTYMGWYIDDVTITIRTYTEVYSAETIVVGLSPYTTTNVSFTYDFTTAGDYVIFIETNLTGDEYTMNDKLYDVFTFENVIDLGVMSINFPVEGAIYPPGEFTINVTIQNTGNQYITADFIVNCTVTNSSSAIVWTDTELVSVTTFVPGANIWLEFSPSWSVNDTEVYTIVVTTLFEADTIPANNMTAITITIDGIIPIADAGIDQTVDEGELVVFDGSGSADPNDGIIPAGNLTYVWTFNNGTADITLVGMIQSYVFDYPGIYVVTLTVIDEVGNSASDTMTVTVNDITSPIADAGADTIIPENTMYTFDGTGSYDPDGGTIVNYNWSFYDDGWVYLDGVTPTYTFYNVGEFNVTLIVTDAVGYTAQDTVTISVFDDTIPIADAGADVAEPRGTTVTFNATNSYDPDGDTIANYTWTFLYDNEWRTLTGAIREFTFYILGNYEVTLVVIDSDDATNIGTDIMYVNIIDTVPPVADAGDNLTIVQGDIVTFDATASYDPDYGEITNYSWSFEYGESLIHLYGAIATFRFELAGNYTVTLTVRDTVDLEATDTIWVLVAIVNQAPVAIIDLPLPGSHYLTLDTIKFNCSSSYDPDNDALTYIWSSNLVEEELYNGTEPEFMTTLQVHGEHIITLIVKDVHGDIDITTVIITVWQPELHTFINPELNSQVTTYYGGDGKILIEPGELVVLPPMGYCDIDVCIDFSPVGVVLMLWANVSIGYNDLGLPPWLDETTLTLYYWKPSTSVWVKVMNQHLDTEDNILCGNVTHLTTFAIFGEADIEAPWVMEVYPKPNATGIPVDTTIWIKFSEQITNSTVILGESLLVVDVENNSVAGNIKYDELTYTVVFTPINRLAYNTTYYVTVTEAIVDLAGNPLSSEYHWHFTTVEKPVSVYPTIIMRYPEPNATDVPIDAEIKVEFDRAMNRTTVEDAFSLMTATGMVVSGDFKWYGNMLIFTPLENLAYETTYKIIIKSTATDLEGNCLAYDYNWSFTTERAPPPPPPPREAPPGPLYILGTIAGLPILLLVIIAIIIVVIIVVLLFIRRKRKRAQLAAMEAAPPTPPTPPMPPPEPEPEPEPKPAPPPEPEEKVVEVKPPEEAPPQPPPPAPEEEKKACQLCGSTLTYIEDYNAWYCYTCAKYPEFEEPTAEPEMKLVEEKEEEEEIPEW